MTVCDKREGINISVAFCDKGREGIKISMVICDKWEGADKDK